MIRINDKKFPFRSNQGQTVEPKILQQDLERYSEYELKKLNDLVKQLNEELEALRARVTALE